MTGAFPAYLPNGAALLRHWGRGFMEVILHLGAHRTATTSFQHYMRDHAAELGRRDIGYWGPARLRRDMLAGLFRTQATNPRDPSARRAEGRTKMMLARTQQGGCKTLIVSDENMIGSCMQNFRMASLYPAIGERMARVRAAFDGQVTRIILSVRAQDLWWASAAAFVVARGHPLPTADRCAQIAARRRGWRDVITDLACAVPDVDITILPFETTAGRPDAVLTAAVGAGVPVDRSGHWLNRSADLNRLRGLLQDQGSDPALLPQGTGRWNPFTPDQCAALRETYADDMHWLYAGADGLAHLTQEHSRSRAGQSLPQGQLTKGHDYAIGQGHLAQYR